MSDSQGTAAPAAPQAATPEAIAAINARLNPETQLLLEAAHTIESLAQRLRDGHKVTRLEISEVLTRNRMLWHYVLDGMAKPECALPKTTRNNIASLCLFVFKRTIEVLCETTPEKMQILIDINRSIALGLSGRIPDPLPAG